MNIQRHRDRILRILLASLSGCLLPSSGTLAVTLGPGDIVAVDTVSDHVVLVDPVTGTQTLISSAGGGSDVVVDDSGRIFMIETNDLIEVDPETGVQSFVAENITDPGDHLQDLALTPAGDIIVSSFSTTPYIVDPDTGAANPIAGPTSSRVGIAVDAGGDLYFAAEVSDELLRYTSTGTFIQSYSLFGVPPNPFGRPGDVAVAPNGDVVVTDRNEELFVRVDPSTGALDVLGPIAFASMPGGIAVEASGDYVLPAVELGSTVGVYRVSATTGAITPLTSGGYFSTGGGLTAVAVAPSTLPEPPQPEDTFVDCPGAGSPLTEPIILCALATGAAGPAFDTESGFASNVGTVNETQSSTGPEASGATDIDSILGQSEIASDGDKLGTTDAGEADVSSGVHWTDDVTIDALGLTGEIGRFKAVFMLLVNPAHTATLGTSASVLAATSYAVEIRTDDFAPWRYAGAFGLADSIAVGPQVLDGGDPPGVYISGFHDFVFGTPFELDVDLQVRLRAVADGAEASATADANTRLFWLGVTDIQALTPLIQPVPDIWVSTASTSGIDWREPQGVPEPGFLLLAGFGGLGVAMLARRRSSAAKH